MDRHTSLIISKEQGRWPRYLNPQILEVSLLRRFKDVPICLRVQPEFNRCVRRRYRGRVRACVCERANCEEGGKKKRGSRALGNAVAEVGEKGTMEPRDERWRRVQTVLPESWWLISTLFTLARRQTVGDRRNNSWSTMDSRPWSLKEIVFIVEIPLEKK